MKPALNMHRYSVTEFVHVRNWSPHFSRKPQVSAIRVLKKCNLGDFGLNLPEPEKQ